MVITELDVGGAEKAFVRIALGLKSRGWQVDVVSLRNAGPMKDLLQQGEIRVTALGCGGAWDVRAIWRLTSHLRRIQPDIVLSFLHQANLVSRIAARWSGIRKAVSGVRVADRRVVITWPDRLTAFLVSKYVAVSKSVASVHADCLRLKEQPVVIPNGVDAEAVAAAQPSDRRTIDCRPEDFIILCVGRLSVQKAPLDALIGFQKLLEMAQQEISSRLRLVFVGDGPLEPALRQQVAQRKLSAHVRLAGWRPDVWGLMKASNLLLLASHWEGLPNVVMEAQAAGLPVVASKIDGNSELIRSGENGRLFGVGNVEQLSQVLLDAIQNTDQTQKMASVARTQIQAWTWESAVQAYDQMLSTELKS